MALANLFSNVNLYESPIRNSEMVALSKATSTDAFAVGDFIEADTYAGTCKVVDAATNSAFLGLSMTTLLTSDTTTLCHIAIRGLAQIPLAVGEVTIYFGEGAAWSTGANGTAWTLANTNTGAAFHCYSKSVAAGATGLWMFDPYTVRAVTGIGYFELPG